MKTITSFFESNIPDDDRIVLRREAEVGQVIEDHVVNPAWKVATAIVNHDQNESRFDLGYVSEFQSSYEVSKQFYFANSRGRPEALESIRISAESKLIIL